jgi:hypothetical protein
MEEIQAGELYEPGGRIRKEGGGRKKLEVYYPGVEAAAEKIADPKGDPMSSLRWTSRSMEKIAKAACAQGYPISPMGVHRILRLKGFALKSNKKELEGKSNHPDRNTQFEHMRGKVKEMEPKGVPTVSVDAKKTELIGNYKNHGREWQPTGSDVRVNVHDFGEKDENERRIKAIPYGV